MKKEWRWFQIGSGLVLSVVFLTVLPACKPLIEVTVQAQCAPVSMKDKDNPPTGCKRNPVTGQCM